MTYSLDTNACIQFIRGRSRPLIRRLASITADRVTICSIVRAELHYGACKSNDIAKTLREQQRFLEPYGHMDFDWRAAEVFGEWRVKLERRGTPIGPYDLQIAAIALANNQILVTHNTKEFSRIDGLRLEDWEA